MRRITNTQDRRNLRLLLWLLWFVVMLGIFALTSPNANGAVTYKTVKKPVVATTTTTLPQDGQGYTGKPIIMTMNPDAPPVPANGGMGYTLTFTSNGTGVSNGYRPTVTGGVPGETVVMNATGMCYITSNPLTLMGQVIPIGTLVFIGNSTTCTLTAVEPYAYPATQYVTKG